MRRLERIDALIHLGVLFYRYCPLPGVRMVPLLVFAWLASLYLKWLRYRGW